MLKWIVGGGIVVAILAAGIGPICVIWALNTLFVLSIPLTWKTWAATLLLCAVISGGGGGTRK